MSAHARMMGVTCISLLVCGSGLACTKTSADEATESLDEDLTGGAKVFGLGVDAPTALQSPHFAALRSGWRTGNGFSLEAARTVFNMDPSFDEELGKLRAWVDAVVAGGLTPVVAIEPARQDGPCGEKHTCVVIDDATYRDRFRTLLEQFPEVTAWGPVNEPDVIPKYLRPGPDGPVEQAVDFFVDAAHELVGCKQHGGCKHVSLFAGEFAGVNEGYWHRYAARMHSEVEAGHLPHFPHVWGLHPYGDTTDGSAHMTNAYDAFLAGVEKSLGLGARALRVWITESGTLLEWHDPPICRDNGNAHAQYHGASAVYEFAKKARVDRVYWWQFQQGIRCWGGNWDSAMADWNGVPRPSFCALAQLPISECTGGLHARDCGGPGRGPC